MLAVVEVATPFVVIGNAALVAPAAMDTLGGTEATVLSLAKLTAIPPADAGLLNLTVPTPALPPLIFGDETMSLYNVGGNTFRVVC